MSTQLDLFSDIEPEPVLTPKQEVLNLRRELEEANYRYYVLSEPTMSDFDFDKKLRRLQDLENAHPELRSADSPTQHVGSDLQKKSGFQQLAHRYPMLSLANTYSEMEIRQWYQRVVNDLGTDDVEIVAELKYDGLSISLWYEDGKLTHALTRGDGTRGDDVIDNIKTIRSIPWEVGNATFEIRGEVLMPWASFDRLNAERAAQEEALFANPRNAASGTLKQQDPRVVAERQLEAYLYYFIAPQSPSDTHYGCLEYAKGLGFNISSAISVCHSIEDIMRFIAYWDTERKNLPVATDGVVLKVNNLGQQQQLGYTAKTPRWAIAFKYKAERQATLLEKITYQVGRTGIITPVANLTPVQLSGSVVSRATLHNEDFVRQLGIQEGDMVFVEKGGEIIPKIVGIAEEGKGERLPYQFPTVCPECGAMLVRDPEEAAWRCPNEDHCSPQIKGKIEHFVERKAMNIDGLGSETIAAFYERGLIQNIADIYDLRKEQIMTVEGFKQKSAQNIIDGINRSKEVPWERVLFAIGIRYIGETMAKKLARHYTSVDQLMSTTKEELLTLDDIGEQLANSILEYFANPQNIEIVERLRHAELQFESTAAPTLLSDKLAGQNIVVSGVFANHSRDEIKQLIEQHGGTNSSSVSKRTSFIVAGDNMGPEKRRKAEQLGIPILTEEEFIMQLNIEN